MATLVYIGLGSNLDNPMLQVTQAVAAIADIPQTTLQAASPWYQSKAIGPGEQDDYINGAVAVTTTLDEHALLDALQAIENTQGRVRVVRWGERTLDLDILLFGGQTINTERLTVPHPYLKERNFVLYPLFDLAPDLQLPCGLQIKTLISKIGQEGLDRVS